MIVLHSTLKGLAGTASLLAVYFSILSLISGWSFALNQFAAYWYYIVSLAAGFGIQIGLFTYLKHATHHQAKSGKVLAVSGTTSTAAMISCCAHYLTNILPVLGVAGVISFIGQYQIELFWVGLAFNLAGIAYIVQKVLAFHRAMAVIPAP